MTSTPAPDDVDALTPVAAVPVGMVVAFALGAATAPWSGRVLDRVVLCVLVAVVATVGRVAGCAAALVTALMAATSFDFFHVRPLGVLHVRGLLLASLLFGAIAVVSGALHRHHVHAR